MEAFATIQGRKIGPAEVAVVLHMLAAHPDWPRSRISRELCRRWDLRGHEGQLKDMACRNLLLKLERVGVLTLPPRRRPGPNAYRNLDIAEVVHEITPVACTLRSLEPLSVAVVQRGSAEERLFNCLVRQYHYLGLRSTVGENLKYLIRAGCGRPLACLLFGSAAWQTQPRDQFIGWDHPTRERNLQLVTNNTRFLVLPWVRVPCLASRVLSLVTRQVRIDWEAKYGHAVHLLETFVDISRFRGTCYRAANWLRLGETTGRTRNNRCKRIRTTVKDVYVYPLSAKFRKALCR